jgi:lipid A 4'-phosphatase
MTEAGLGGWLGPARPARGRGLRRQASRAVARLGLLTLTPPRPLEPISLFLCAIALFSLLFLVFPVIDLGVSHFFFSVGDGFPAAHNPVLRALRKSSGPVLMLLVAGLVARLVWELVRRGPGALMSARRSVYLLACLAVGPGLVINGLLKAHWGRPRPLAVDLFGGDAPYQTVWRMSHWCHSNCSFVSGEASSAAWFVAALVLVPARYRLAAGVPVTLYALLLSASRVAFGGHFLSDVVLSWMISGLVFAVLYRLLVSAPGVARRARTAGAPVILPV